MANDAVVYRFTITKQGVISNLVKTLVVLAIRETDLVFGSASRKLETNIRFFTDKPICVIEGGTECGEHLAKLLSGFLIKQLSEDGFVVQRLYRKQR